MRSDASKGLHDKEDLSRADLCVAPNAAPPLGTTGRNKKTPAATAFCSLIFVEPLDDYRGLFQVTDGYVRRYWTALLDSSAVADLLRRVGRRGGQGRDADRGGQRRLVARVSYEKRIA